MVRGDVDKTVGRDSDVEDGTLEEDVGDGEGGPGGGEARMEGEAIHVRLEAEEAVEHDLRDEDAFEELAIEAEAAGGAATLEGAAAEGIVVFVVSAVAAFGLDAVEPREDSFKALPGVIGAAGDEASHEVVIREAEDGATVLNLPAEGDDLGMSPGVVIVVYVAFGGGARGKFPVVDVGPMGSVVGNDARAFEPLHDSFGLRGGREAGGDGFTVEEGETVIVHAAREVEGGEAGGSGIPELGIRGLESVGDAEEAIGGEVWRWRWDAP